MWNKLDNKKPLWNNLILHSTIQTQTQSWYSVCATLNLKNCAYTKISTLPCLCLGGVFFSVPRGKFLMAHEPPSVTIAGFILHNIDSTDSIWWN